MKFVTSFAVAGLALVTPSLAWAQYDGTFEYEGRLGPVAMGTYTAFERLPSEALDVVPPSAWVDGQPGGMQLRTPECRTVPDAQLRKRIIDVAVQEWLFFGAPVLDRLNGARLLPPGVVSNPGQPMFEPTTRRPRSLNARESLRVAASIAGYWAVTPEGASIVEDQNATWNRRGVDSRWRSPWSAAFVSWVMCEAGLGTTARFRYAIAHRTYIDQAIRARDGQDAEAAYVAYDVGEQLVKPGDLLCSGRRPRYHNIAERRRQMGTGASSHCDIVVEVDGDRERILAIGGNVLRSVSLKVLPGQRAAEGGLRALSTDRAPLFAHLKLRAGSVAGDALGRSPALATVACAGSGGVPTRELLVLSELEIGALPASTC